MPVPSTEILLSALQHRYQLPSEAEPNVSAETLQQTLLALPATPAASDKRLLTRLQEEHPQWVLPAAEFALLAAIDDCTRLTFRLITLAPKIDQDIRSVMPLLAGQLLQAPLLPLTDEVSLLTILDRLGEALIGWSADLGRSGDTLLARLDTTLQAIRTDPASTPAIAAELQDYLQKDQARIDKLETRLTATETGRLRSRQSMNLAASTINKAMHDKLLTASIVEFLKGHWFGSVQLLLLKHGADSELWQRAVKITETIIWTYQPLVEAEDELPQAKQRLYRILENLPAEIRQLLVALEQGSNAAEFAMEYIEDEQVSIISGQALQYCSFTPISCDEPLSNRSKVSRLLLTKVEALQIGQWFVLCDADQETRIKLILKLSDVRQLVFTNRNGMKVLEKSFDEFAYYLSSGRAKSLNHEAIFSSTFAAHFYGLIEEQARQSERLRTRKIQFDQVQEASEAEDIAAQQAARAAALLHQQAQAEEAQRLLEVQMAAARAEANKAENAAKLQACSAAVEQLHVGAWLRLPNAGQAAQECKLAVRIASADKMIFVNRTGIKIGEYNSAELAQLLAAGQGEILDQGVEFEDTLAQVVNRLRQDRTKSYDDLTGG
jgi:hypothetical protein